MLINGVSDLPAAGGAIVGTILSLHLSSHRLQKAFAVFVLFIAVFYGCEKLHGFILKSEKFIII